MAMGASCDKAQGGPLRRPTVFPTLDGRRFSGRRRSPCCSFGCHLVWWLVLLLRHKDLIDAGMQEQCLVGDQRIRSRRRLLWMVVAVAVAVVGFWIATTRAEGVREMKNVRKVVFQS